MRRKIAPTCQVNRRLYNRATDRPGFVGIVPRNRSETSRAPGFVWNCPGIYCNSRDFDQVLHYIRSFQHLPHVSCEFIFSFSGLYYAPLAICTRLGCLAQCTLNQTQDCVNPKTENPNLNENHIGRGRSFKVRGQEWKSAPSGVLGQNPCMWEPGGICPPHKLTTLFVKICYFVSVLRMT